MAGPRGPRPARPATLNRLDISSQPVAGAVQYLVVAIFRPARAIMPTTTTRASRPGTRSPTRTRSAGRSPSAARRSSNSARPEPSSTPPLSTSSPDRDPPAIRCRTAPAPWIAVRRSSPVPVFVKPCASPGGLTTTWPPSTTTIPSPIWNVAWPDSTMNTSAYGCRCSFGPTPGSEWTRMIENGTSPCSAPTNSCECSVCSRSSSSMIGSGLRCSIGSSIVSPWLRPFPPSAGVTRCDEGGRA